MPLLRSQNRLCKSQFPAENSQSLRIPQRSQRTTILAKPRAQHIRLRNQPTIEHPSSPLVDALVQRLTLRPKRQLQHTIPPQSLTTLLPLHGLRLTGRQRHLNTANQLRSVIRMDQPSSPRIQPLQHTMQPSRPQPRSPIPQPLPKHLITRRSRSKPLDQSPKIQTSSTSNNRKPASPTYRRNRRSRMSRIIACSTSLIRPVQIQAVMRNTLTLFRRRLRRTNIHQAINRNRVATNDFSTKLLSQHHRKRRLPTGRRTSKYKQRRIHFVAYIDFRHGLHQPCVNTRPNPARNILSNKISRARKISARTILRS